MRQKIITLRDMDEYEAIMRGDRQDLKDLAEDLKGCVNRHQDAIRHNPDIAAELIKVRDKTMKRWEDLSERPKHD